MDCAGCPLASGAQHGVCCDNERALYLRGRTKHSRGEEDSHWRERPNARCRTEKFLSADDNC
jgi:hypothetical protein